jgi:HAD superfamily hydrolase (TIGR01484 family)
MLVRESSSFAAGPGEGGVRFGRKCELSVPGLPESKACRFRKARRMSAKQKMRPLAELSREARAGIVGVLADIDDTITSEGRLTAAAYTALERLHAAGIKVIPVTGRPAGWCDHIARMWPVDAVVGENGAFWMRYDAHAGRLKTVFVGHPPPDPHARHEQIAAEILAAVPGCALASDQFCRIADLAIDFREDVAPLPRTAVDAIVQRMEAAGMRAKVSSIHVNGWFGDYDKLSTTRRMLAEEFGIALEQGMELERWIFVGDSPNDVPMFGFFPNSVGVANVLDFAGRLAAEPAWVTRARAGAGFVELSEALLAACGIGTGK